MSDEHPTVLVERPDDADGVVVLTLNRPEARNPLDRRTLTDLHDLLARLTADESVGAIVVTGAPPAFSAGGDLKGYQDLYRAPAEFQQFLDTFHRVNELLERSPAVTVAMVNGTCVAGGLELALACDLITMADSARIGDGHLNFGQLSGAGGSQRLVRTVGLQRARQLLLSGELVDAGTALAMGLITSVHPADRLRAETLAMLAPMVRHSRLAVWRMKDLVRVATDLPLAEGLLEEQCIVHEYATGSHDATEGLLAFAERRPPRYRGR